MARFSRELLFRQGSAPVIAKQPLKRGGAHKVPAIWDLRAGAAAAIIWFTAASGSFASLGGVLSARPRVS